MKRMAITYKDTHDFSAKELEELFLSMEWSLPITKRRAFTRPADLKRQRTQVPCLLRRFGRKT